MKLISFIVPPLGSHLYASMGLARRLKTTGYGVEYWGDSRIQEFIQEQGFAFRPLDGLWGMRPPEIELPKKPVFHPILTLKNVLVRRQWRARLLSAMIHVDASISELLRGKKPDLVVFDPFRLAYYPFLHRRGIPGVVLTDKALATPDPRVPPQTSRLVPGHTFFRRQLVRISWIRLGLVDGCRRLMGRLAGWVGAYTYNDLVVAVAKLSGFCIRSERLRRWLWYDMHFKSIPEWVLWTPEMDFPRSNPLPQNIRYVGPSVDSSRREAELVLQRRPETRYLIYVAMGTTVAFEWQKDVSLLSKVVRAFEEVPDVEVWIATGDDRVTAALGSPPPHVRVFPFLPQLQVLDIADLMITHAGAGTLRECIMKEVPMLAYPRAFDQFGNSARIVYLGLGLRGDRNWDGASSIRRKALRILKETRFRENLHALRAQIEKREGGLLANALEQVFPTGKSRWS